MQILSPPMLVHHFLEESARLRPEKIALIHDNVRATYGQINLWANRLANLMVSGGVSPGDRVALFMENGLEYIVGYYAALKAGAVAVPLCSELTSEGVSRFLLNIEPAACIMSAKQERRLIELRPDVVPPLVILKGERPAGISASSISWDDVFRTCRDAAAPDIHIAPQALASIIFTSGSTGDPKGVMLSHLNIVANTLSIIDFLQLTDADIQMVVLPFYYVMGKSLLNTHFAVGGTVVINNRFAFAAQLIEQMIAERVTGFSGVPSTYTYLVHRSPLAACRDKLQSLRYCTQAGGHLSRQTKQALLQILPDRTKMFVMYGATEASARLAYVEPERLAEKMDSIGKSIPGVSLSVRDEEGMPAKVGEIGEIIAAGPNIMQGYWRDAEATAKVLGPYGYHTGDLGFCDDDGYFYVVGRKDNLLKIGGHRINPKEVEDALIGTELLIEVAVLGIRDEMLEQRLVAVAAPKSAGCSEKDILRRCVKVLPKYKMPAAVKLVESLPKKPNGKVDSGRCQDLIMDYLQVGKI